MSRDITIGEPPESTALRLVLRKEHYPELADPSALWLDGKWYPYPLCGHGLGQRGPSESMRANWETKDGGVILDFVDFWREVGLLRICGIPERNHKDRIRRKT
jgi:hypothetical protein